jgi:CheY-like chemotaxis protein/HPt (histidine-containing phosphotransfer) domain-containing protein
MRRTCRRIDLSVSIDAIWEKSREEIDRRIGTLEAALAAMRALALGDELRAHAERDAHKLAGSLGMFGFPTGSDLAREVEQVLGVGGGPDLCDVRRLGELVRVLRDEFETRTRGRRSSVPLVALTGSQALGDRAVGPGRGGQDTATPVTGSRTILVIDDSALIRRVVETSLGGDQGCRVSVAESGAEGIELASRERPDAILLDVEMPDLDGPATLARLRAQEATQEIPVLFLTGHAGEDDCLELEALGVAGVIAKPFDPESLAGEVSGRLGWRL